MENFSIQKKWKKESVTTMKCDEEIPSRFARFIKDKTEFFDDLKSCTEDAFHDDIDWDRFDQMTRILEDVLDGKIILRREITVDDVDKLVDDIRNGDNGLGTSWSYESGHCVDSCGSRYNVEFFAKVLTPETIDYETTYCRDQHDVDCMNPDLEVTIEEGGKVLLEKIDINDSETGKFWTIEIGIPVTIAEES